MSRIFTVADYWGGKCKWLENFYQTNIPEDIASDDASKLLNFKYANEGGILINRTYDGTFISIEFESDERFTAFALRWL
jgi:hypothetical protein